MAPRRCCARTLKALRLVLIGANVVLYVAYTNFPAVLHGTLGPSTGAVMLWGSAVLLAFYFVDFLICLWQDPQYRHNPMALVEGGILLVSGALLPFGPQYLGPQVARRSASVMSVSACARVNNWAPLGGGVGVGAPPPAPPWTPPGRTDSKLYTCDADQVTHLPIAPPPPLYKLRPCPSYSRRRGPINLRLDFNSVPDVVQPHKTWVW